MPHVILNALAGKPLPVYGDGSQIRDWLYEEDHAHALVEVVSKRTAGETYNIGGHTQKPNLKVVEAICTLLDELVPLRSDREQARFYTGLITFVKDRPRHDQRYAIDASKIEREQGWVPQDTLRPACARPSNGI